MRVGKFGSRGSKYNVLRELEEMKMDYGCWMLDVGYWMLDYGGVGIEMRMGMEIGFEIEIGDLRF